jgi:hypothetical protein
MAPSFLLALNAERYGEEVNLGLPPQRAHRHRLGPPVVQVSPGGKEHYQPPVVDLRFLLQQPGALGRSLCCKASGLALTSEAESAPNLAAEFEGG